MQPRLNVIRAMSMMSIQEMPDWTLRPSWSPLVEKEEDVPLGSSQLVPLQLGASWTELWSALSMRPSPLRRTWRGWSVSWSPSQSSRQAHSEALLQPMPSYY